MIQPFFDFIEKFATDFSWRRLIIFFTLIVIIGFAFFFYESQTFNNELTAYERTIALLEKTDKFDHKDKLANQAVENVHRGLVEITSKKNIDTSLDIEIQQEVKQAIAGSIIWILFALFLIPRAFRENKNNDIFGIVGCLIIGVFTGTVGYFLPTNWSDWILFGLYPVGFNLILFILFAAYGNRSK
ncbi:hypothetical protein NJR55_06635 [Idiomarina sp. M1R2S28]|uniref:Uncharacterized protein n=1 Tax=Idiomarina rhizosphaerae TaxID=2961572 RepID=A0A9X2JRW4_9GAMM|nr:hypothetical protein [Idiomarina rhizosphaerae]MCP1339268.1 hypothetical protein [Idiomarina rhizosphaerae]